jgi:RNA polymerase sigma-70 factor (ECF subfamily)
MSFPLRDGKPRFETSAEQQGELLQRFLDALAADDKDAMVALFAPDATFVSDGGGKVRAARRILEGPDRIARFLLGLEHKYRGLITHELAELNGQPALASYRNGALYFTTAFETDGERIIGAYRVLNPDKVAHLR